MSVLNSLLSPLTQFEFFIHNGFLVAILFWGDRRGGQTNFSMEMLSQMLLQAFSQNFLPLYSVTCVKIKQVSNHTHATYNTLTTQRALRFSSNGLERLDSMRNECK